MQNHIVYLVTVWISIQSLNKICCSLQEDFLQRTHFYYINILTIRV